MGKRLVDQASENSGGLLTSRVVAEVDAIFFERDCGIWHRRGVLAGEAKLETLLRGEHNGLPAATLQPRLRARYVGWLPSDAILLSHEVLSLPNVKDEPRRELARSVRQHDP